MVLPAYITTDKVFYSGVKEDGKTMRIYYVRLPEFVLNVLRKVFG